MMLCLRMLDGNCWWLDCGRCCNCLYSSGNRLRIFSQILLACLLRYVFIDSNFALQGLHISMATHDCGISSKSGVYPSDYSPSISPHKP